MPAATRRQEIAAAISISQKAAQEDARWADLRDSLLQVNAALQAIDYRGKITPAGQANYLDTAHQCALSGQKP